MGNDKLSGPLDELHEQMASLQELQHGLDRSVLANITQIKIARELLRGRRTVARLVEEFHGLRKGDPDFSTLYSRVRKEMGDLESRGLVSRKMFGRDRPYGLTQVGVERLTQLRGDPSPKVFSVLDALTYASALILGTICAGVIMAGVAITTPVTLLSFLFVFVGGLAFSHLARVLRRLRPLPLPRGETVDSEKGGETTMRKEGDRQAPRFGGPRGPLSMTTKVLGLGVLFGAVFLALGSVTLLGLGDGPTFVGIPEGDSWEVPPSRGERFTPAMDIDDLRDQFRLSEEEVSQLAVLVEERDALQDQAGEKLTEIRDIIGPGVHELDAKKLQREFDLTDEETARLEGLIEDWLGLSSETREKIDEILDFLASIRVIRARSNRR
jgi:hypothetical protein